VDQLAEAASPTPPKKELGKRSVMRHVQTVRPSMRDSHEARPSILRKLTDDEKQSWQSKIEKDLNQYVNEAIQFHDASMFKTVHSDARADQRKRSINVLLDHLRVTQTTSKYVDLQHVGSLNTKLERFFKRQSTCKSHEGAKRLFYLFVLSQNMCKFPASGFGIFDYKGFKRELVRLQYIDSDENATDTEATSGGESGMDTDGEHEARGDSASGSRRRRRSSRH
jgi:hypothetical protein